MKISEYDLVIIGGGLVGASLAAALLKNNFNIAIVDKNSAPENSIENFNSKAIALSWSSVQLLKNMGVWSFLLTPETIREVQVSEQGHFAVTRIRSEDFGVPFLGAVINADSLNFGLNHYLLKNSGKIQNSEQTQNSRIDFFRNTEIKRLARKNVGWELELLDGQIFQTTLLVGADGSDSFLRKQQGVAFNAEPHMQSAIVVNLGLKQGQSHKGVAYERFLETGAIAMLPFGEQRVKCVWIMPNKEVSTLMEKEDKAFLQAVQTAFGFRLGVLDKLGKRTTYAIQTGAAENFYGRGWVLIGNAANTLNPVAAQGFNLGLRDACILAEELSKAGELDKVEEFIKVEKSSKTGKLTRIKKKSIELQDIYFLQCYAERRLADHARVKQFIQQLAAGGLKRRLGIFACEFISPLKHWLGRLGMGFNIANSI